MKINIQNSSLAVTAGLAAQFPDGRKPQIVFSGLHIILLGRRNSGKSSLINALLGRRSLARVSSSPGKTITVNFYDVDGKVFFVDIPGYGYAKRAPQDKKRWSQLTDSFLHSECDRRLVLQLIDMKAGPTSDDFMMLDWLDATESDYVIVATKSDKLNRTDYALALTELEKLGAKVIPFSALSKAGRDEVLKTVFDFLN